MNFATRLPTSAKIITPLSAFCKLQLRHFVYRHSAKLSLVYRRSANFVPINDFLQTSSQIYRFSSNLVTRLSAFIKLRFSFFGFLQTSSLVCRHSAKLSLVYRHSANFTRLSSAKLSLVYRRSANFVTSFSAFCKLRHSFADIVQTSSLLYRRSANFVYRFSAFVKLRFSFICFLQISSLVYRYSAKLSLVYRRSANFVPINDFLQTSSQIYRFSSNLVTRLSAFIKLRFSFFGFLQTSSLVCRHSAKLSLVYRHSVNYVICLSTFCILRQSFIGVL